MNKKKIILKKTIIHGTWGQNPFPPASSSLNIGCQLRESYSRALLLWHHHSITNLTFFRVMQSCNQLSGHISSGGAQPRPPPADGGHFVLALPGRPPPGFRAATEADLLPSLIPSLFVWKVLGCPLVFSHHTHTQPNTSPGREFGRRSALSCCEVSTGCSWASRLSGGFRPVSCVRGVESKSAWD